MYSLSSTGWFQELFLSHTKTDAYKCVSFAFLFVFCASLCPLCSRKPSLKEKGSPSKSTGGKETKTLKTEDGVKESQSKVTKSLSFTAKHAFRMRDGASRQNSEGQRMLLCPHMGLLGFPLLYTATYNTASKWLHSPVYCMRSLTYNTHLAYLAFSSFDAEV